jgi:hypothetical protein
VLKRGLSEVKQPGNQEQKAASGVGLIGWQDLT